MTPEILMQPRIKVIAEDTSGEWNVGDILEFIKCEHGYYHEHWKDSQKTVWYIDYAPRPKQSFATYPHLFRELPWYEERTLDDLMSVKYVRITVYTGYWRVGDVVNVTDYKIDTKNKKLELYILDGTQQSLPERCEPAALEEYKANKELRTGRKQN